MPTRRKVRPAGAARRHSPRLRPRHALRLLRRALPPLAAMGHRGAAVGAGVRIAPARVVTKAGRCGRRRVGEEAVAAGAGAAVRTLRGAVTGIQKSGGVKGVLARTHQWRTQPDARWDQ